MSKLDFQSNYINILEKIKNHLPDRRYESIRDLLYHNEGFLGLEIMLDNIEELEIDIDRATLQLIEECSAELGLDLHRWKAIVESIKV